MAPMCTNEATENGEVQPFHITHYVSRAMGEVGLIMVEATAISRDGRISPKDLGLWDDQLISGLEQLVTQIKAYGAKTAIQLAHAGRKATVEGKKIAPSAIAFSKDYATPNEMTIEEIQATVLAFKQAALRAIKAGFDVLEIHAAHGYLLSTFLSPLTNKREDVYGGSEENRYRFIREVIDAIRSVWDGPLLVRVSANDFAENGLEAHHYIQFSRWMATQEVDLIDVSSGGVVPAKIVSHPLYQVPFAETIKIGAHVPTGAVGLITTGKEAEQVLQQGSADLIFIGRELLRDPYFPYRAAKQLGYEIEPTVAVYKRGW